MRIARIFNTFGPRLREDGLYGRAVSRFIMQALTGKPITIYGDGKQTRSFCYIADTITGLTLLVSNEKAKGETVNIGNSSEITILRLAKIIKELAKSESQLAFRPSPKDDPKRRCPKISKMEEMLGWSPKTRWKDGLQRDHCLVSNKRDSRNAKR